MKSKTENPKILSENRAILVLLMSGILNPPLHPKDVAVESGSMPNYLWLNWVTPEGINLELLFCVKINCSESKPTEASDRASGVGLVTFLISIIIQIGQKTTITILANMA